jgi:hypothetical protein
VLSDQSAAKFPVNIGLGIPPAGPRDSRQRLWLSSLPAGFNIPGSLTRLGQYRFKPDFLIGPA